MALLSCHLTIVLLCLWVAVETAPADARIQVDNPPPPNSSSISFLSSSARTSPFFRTFLKSEFDNLAVNYLRLRVGVNGSEAVISSNCSHSAAARHTYPAASSPSEAFDVEGWSTRGQQPPLGRATQHEGQKDSNHHNLYPSTTTTTTTKTLAGSQQHEGQQRDSHQPNPYVHSTIATKTLITDTQEGRQHSLYPNQTLLYPIIKTPTECSSSNNNNNNNIPSSTMYHNESSESFTTNHSTPSNETLLEPNTYLLQNLSLLEEHERRRGKNADGDEEGDKDPQHLQCPSADAIATLGAWSAVIKDRELLCVVNPHWLTFDPPSTLCHVVLALVYLVLMAVGVVGNGLVIYLFVSSRALRTPSNLFILNLAISDFFLVAAMALVVHNSLHEGPATGKVGCDAYGFMGGLTGTTSIMTLAAISFDRYLVISYPLDPFKRLSNRQVVGMILVTWLYAFTFSVMPLVGLANIHYAPEGFLTTCSFDYLSDVTNTRIYIFSFFVAAWVLPLNVISFSYLSIVTTVSREERYCDTCQDTFNSFKHQSIKKKKSVEMKLAKVASGIIGLWVAAWTPYAVVSLLGIFSKRHLITPLVSMVPALFCKTAACLDPFVYALSHPRFKKEIHKRIFRRKMPFLSSVKNGLGQGFSASTFSEMKEDRELSGPQAWDTVNDPSLSSVGPLLQRNASYSSNPALNSDRVSRRRDTLSSPSSHSLVSPTGEVYPRNKTLSTYSFRRSRQSFKKHEELNKVLPTVHDHTQIRTKALIEMPGNVFPQLPITRDCSYTSGMEELNDMLPKSPPLEVLDTSHLVQTTTLGVTIGDAAIILNGHKNDNHSSGRISSSRNELNKFCCSRNSIAMTLILPTVASPLSPSRPGETTMKVKGRSNSLPNMSQQPQRQGGETRFTRSVLMQIFQGKLLQRTTENRSHSSLYHEGQGEITY